MSVRRLRCLAALGVLGLAGCTVDNAALHAAAIDGGIPPGAQDLLKDPAAWRAASTGCASEEEWRACAAPQHCVASSFTAGCTPSKRCVLERDLKIAAAGPVTFALRQKYDLSFRYLDDSGTVSFRFERGAIQIGQTGVADKWQDVYSIAGTPPDLQDQSRTRSWHQVSFDVDGQLLAQATRLRIVTESRCTGPQPPAIQPDDGWSLDYLTIGP